MNQNVQLLLIVIGLVVIVGLLLLIRNQLRTQHQVKKEHDRIRAEYEAKAQEQKEYLVDSVRVISLAMQDGQCELAEGCIRLKMLLDHLAPYLHEHEDFCIINQMYESTKHMPILDEWKKLKIKPRLEMTMEREALENQHKEAVVQAVKKLAHYQFEQ